MSQAYSPLIHTGSTGRPTPSSSPAHPAPPRFLAPLTGKYDQLVDLRGEELCVRYCFARMPHAEAFPVAFAGAALKSRFRMAG
jgi:hypothetical protein